MSCRWTADCSEMHKVQELQKQQTDSSATGSRGGDATVFVERFSWKTLTSIFHRCVEVLSKTSTKMTSGLIWLIDDFALLICKNICPLDRKWRQYQTGDTLIQVSFLHLYFLVTFYETVLFNNTKVCTSWQFRDHNTETRLLLLDWMSKKLLSNQTGLRIQWM